MTQREVRNEIFKLLFEYEISKTNLLERKMEVLEELRLNKSKKEFFETYLNNILINEEEIKKHIKDNIKGWNFSRLGIVEKVILKMSFYEILIDGVGYEIAINEAIELSKMYGDESMSSFINGILADLIRNKLEI